jgi:hypothetical protein
MSAMSPGPDTESLIRKLSQQAGGRRAGIATMLVRSLPAAVALALAIALAMIWLVVGVRADFWSMIQGAPFHHKLAVTLALGIGGFVLARRAGQAERSQLPLLALLPGIALLAFGAMTDRSGLSPLGASGVSVPICVGAILMVSMPALAILLGVIRLGAPTRPSLAGAAAGLLAGAVGAAAYTIACKNDGGLFIAIWYPAAILTVAALGALVGRRALAW